MAKKKLLTQKQYAAHLGISQQAVNRMLHAGRIPNVHGRIDCKAADAALAPTDAQTGGRSIAEAARRKEWALAGLREIELQRKRGEVVELAEFSTALAKYAMILRSQILRFPSILVTRLVDDEVRRIAFTEATECARQHSSTCPVLWDCSKILGCAPLANRVCRHWRKGSGQRTKAFPQTDMAHGVNLIGSRLRKGRLQGGRVRFWASQLIRECFARL